MIPRLRDVPLAKKLNIAYGTILVVPVAILVIVANTLVTRSAIERETGRSLQSASVVTQAVESLVDHVVDLSKITVSDLQVQEIVSARESMTDAEFFVARRVLGTVLDGIIEPRTVVTSMVVYGIDGVIGASSAVQLPEVDLAPDLRQYVEGSPDALRRHPIYRDTHRIDYHSASEPTLVVTLLRQIVNASNGSVMGFLEVNVAVERIAELFGTVSDQPGQAVLIVNSDGAIVVGGDDDEGIGTQQTDQPFAFVTATEGYAYVDRDEGMLYSFVPVPSLRWYVVHRQLLSNVLANVRALVVSMYIIGGVCVLLGLGASRVLSHIIARPIIDLAGLMEKAGSGDLSIRSDHQSGDEVGLLTMAFNRMIGRIGNLVEEVSQAQRRQREYEIAALQEQINPHFLYNTLENVCALSKSGRGDDVLRMVTSLSRFYRMVLNDGRNVVTVGEEIRMIEYYLDIQKIRYADRVDVHVDIDPLIQDVPIVRLTLQPIVENAIYHGLKRLARPGTISISGGREAGAVLLTVQDDGEGIPADQIDFLLRHDESSPRGFGLWCVHERIKLQFGASYGISVSSTAGLGTRVDVRLPA